MRITPWDYLDPWQKEFLKCLGDKILCTGRQVGKSVICGKDAGDYAIEHPESEPIVIVAPTERQSNALFSKVLTYLLEYYPNEVHTKGKFKPTKKRIVLKNKKHPKKEGVEIYCLPVGLNGLGIRFLTIGRLYVDEASRVPGEVWEAITPALLTTGGDCVFLSTPFGAQGEFYNVWINKDEAYKSFTRFSIDSEKVITERKFSPAWTPKQREKALQKIEQAKARFTKMKFAQEYKGEFLDALRRVFSDELIKACCTGERKERNRRMDNEGDYYLGIDVGRVYDPTTYEIFWAKDIKNVIQCESIVIEREKTTEGARHAIRLHKDWEFDGIGVDDGGLGVGVLDPLLEEDSTKFVVEGLNNASKIINSDDDERPLLKVDMINNLKQMMEHGYITLLNNLDVIASYRSMQFEYKGETIEIHGDNSHIVEGDMRACWIIKTKDLNLYIY